jgi:hypothetical protein
VTTSASAPLPLGSDRVAVWAGTRGVAYEARPDEAWFRQWEPFDTMAPPGLYLNACTFTMPWGHLVLVEPWYAPEDAEPLERTVIAFATHGAVGRRAAARVGEHFNTRTLFLESPPPPRVAIGDALWDEHAATFAASAGEGRAAFHGRVRALLAGWGFQGHVEIRARGGLVVHVAGVAPTPDGYERLAKMATDVVDAALRPR